MTDRQLLFKLFEDLKPAKKFLLIGAVLYLPVTILSVIQPVLIGYAVQHGMLTGGKAMLLTYVAVFFASVLLLAACELAQGYCLQITGQLLVQNLRQKSFDKVQKLSMGFLDSMPMGRLLTRLTNDAEAVVEMFSMGAVQILGDCLFLIGTFLMLFMVDVKLSLYSIMVMPLMVIGMYYFRRWTRKSYIKVREVLSNLNSFLQEYLSGIATVQTSGKIAEVHDDFSAHNQNFLSANRQQIVLDAGIYSFVDAVSYLASAAVLWGAFRLDLQHALSLGVLVAFLEALSRFFQPVRELSNRYVVFQSALVSLDRIYQLFEWPEELDLNGTTKASFKDAITFKGVSFSYQTGEPVLKNVTFTIKKDERIALVGQTGAGKSTVIKLLNRFYPVTAGQILIDGRNIDDMSLGETRKLISAVPQEVFLFQGSLRENLNFGNKKATDEDLWNALDLVQLSALIKRKGGLEALVEAKGQNFSLGERQLIAIARALVTNPPILLLDEATASVDAITERRLQIATKEVLAKRTALVIAHRLSTILDADRILVFHHGQIVASGTHDELLESNAIYAGFIRLQMSGSSAMDVAVM